MDKNRIRRTRLYMPGNDPNLLQNISNFEPDTIILDLEDAVAPSQKVAARILVKYALLNIDFAGMEKGVRINPLETEYGKKDAEMAVNNGAELIFLPKAESAKQVKNLAKIIGDKNVYIAPIIETARGVLHCEDIAGADEKVALVCLGAEDFTNDIGAERTKSGDEIFWARSMIVMGAKANQVQASDTVFSDVTDMDALEQETEFIKSLGFDGKGVIHPNQIEVINEVFKPSQDEIEYAQNVVEAYEKAEKEDKGTVALGNKMIDKPVVERAKRILRLAKIY